MIKMRLSYYPGCTLKQYAKNFEKSTLVTAEILGIELVELPRWNCCGAVASLTSDNLMYHIGAVRNLVRVENMIFAGEISDNRLVTLCSMCFNVLKRSNKRFREDDDMRERINMYLERDGENRYGGGVEVVHFLEILRDEIGFENIKKKVVKNLGNLKISPYYGCTLLRPREIGIDDPEEPKIMENLVTALGGKVVENPYKKFCCGNYYTLGKNKKIVVERTRKIIEAARKFGADLIITSCPLCQFNLDRRQELVKEYYPKFKYMPVLYFTQLMAIAFGSIEEAGLEDNFVNPIDLLKDKGVI